MPLGRVYTVDSGPVSVTSTSQTPILLGTAGSTVAGHIQAFRVGVVSGSGVSYPANGSVLPLLARVANSPSGGTTVTPTPHAAGSSPLAAQTTWAIPSYSTAPTQGGILWGVPIAFTAGADFGDWVTPGSEWDFGPSQSVAVFITTSSAGTATQFSCEVVFAE